MDTIIPLFFIIIMPIVYYMQVDTHTGALFLSSDASHNRYVTQYITSGSSLINKEINTIEVWLSKQGNPTGNIVIGVFDDNRNIVKQFAIIDATTLTNQIKKYTFTVESAYKIKANDYIGIHYANGDANNYVMIRIDNTNPFDGTNSYRCRYSTSWVCDNNEDLAISLAYKPLDKEFSLDKAYSYIISLYDSSVGLVKENASINKYWLWTDNILASKILTNKDTQLSAKINNKVKEYAQTYNITFRHPIGALIDTKAYFNTITDINLTGNIWYSDSNGTEELSCHDYADIAFYKAIYYYKIKQHNKAKDCYMAGSSMFDGYGFRDRAFYADGNRYTTYKLALYKIASDTLGLEGKHVDRALHIIALMQDSNGGVYTHYKEDLSIDSMTNVETTALAIMAYNSKPARPPSDTDTNNNLPIQWYIVIGMVLAGVIAIMLKRY